MILFVALFFTIAGLGYLFKEYISYRKESIIPDKDEPKD